MQTVKKQANINQLFSNPPIISKRNVMIIQQEFYSEKHVIIIMLAIH